MMSVFGTAIMFGLMMIGNFVDLLSSHRHLYIFGTGKNQSLVQQQLQLLDQKANGVKDRSLLITIVQKDDPLFKEYGVKPDLFAVILVGKDGTEKHRANSVIQPQELLAIIDAMPMRKAERQGYE